MRAEVVATPVLERLAAGEARGRVHAVSPDAAYLDLDSGFVVAITARGVPLMPNGVAVDRLAVADGVARAAPGRIEAGAEAVAWDPARPPRWEPALRPVAAGDRDALARRADAIHGAVGDGVAVTARGRGREGARHLRDALAGRDAAAAARAAERLLGLGGGLTPEGDDVLCAAARIAAALGDAVGFAAPERDRCLAALVPAGVRERTTPLSATLLELA